MNDNSPDLFQKICNYHVWADNKLISHLKTFDPDKIDQDLGNMIVNDTNYTNPSVRSLIEHIMMGLYMMVDKMQEITFNPQKTIAQLHVLNNLALLDEWDELNKSFINKAMKNLGKTINFEGQDQVISQELIFVFLDHNIHHRAQIMLALRMTGEQGCDTLFYTFLNQKSN